MREEKQWGWWEPDYPIDATNTKEGEYLFELVHGLHLVNSLLETACASGEGYEAAIDEEDGHEIIPAKEDIFGKYPKLEEARERAQRAMMDFYQAAGAHLWAHEDRRDATL